MITIIFGEDTYRSREYIREYRDVLRSRFNNPVFSRIDASESSEDLLLSSLGELFQGSGLFGGVPVLRIDFLFSSGRVAKEIIALIQNISERDDSVLILWDGALKEKEKKEMKEIAGGENTIMEFKELSGRERSQWIYKKAGELGISLSKDHETELGSLEDSWQIIQRMRDIQSGILLKNSEESSSSVFQLGDFFFSKTTHALRTLLHFFRRGEDERSLFSYLAGLSRVRFMIRTTLDEKKNISASLGIHPFVQKKTASAVRTASLADTKKDLEWFFREDAMIKTGEDDPREALIRFVSKNTQI